jgi:hypothetical protein
MNEVILRQRKCSVEDIANVMGSLDNESFESVHAMCSLYFGVTITRQEYDDARNLLIEVNQQHKHTPKGWDKVD